MTTKSLFLLTLGLFFSIYSFSQKTSVNAQVSSKEGIVGTCQVDFIKNGENYLVIARANGYGNVAEFSRNVGGTVSTSYKNNGGLRWWFCSPYLDANNNIVRYFIVIIDNTTNGADIYFKEASADRKNVSDSKYRYSISSADYDRVFKNWVTPSTLSLKVVKQGDIFGDGVNTNPYVK